MDTLLWNKTYERFVKAKTDKTKLLIDIYDDVYVTVNNIEKLESGCGRCNTKYEAFYLDGTIKTDYFRNELPYYANISQYAMHKCLEDKDEPEFLVLFDGHIEESTDNYIYARYLDVNFAENRIEIIARFQKVLLNVLIKPTIANFQKVLAELKRKVEKYN